SSFIMLSKEQITLLNALGLPGVHKKLIRHILEEPHVVKGITECCINVLKGNVPLSKAQKAKLVPYKRAIRMLARKDITPKRKKKIIIQSGGFLQYVIPAAIGLFSALFNRNGS